MKIRKANLEDMNRILEIYAYARDFMVKRGNPKQWRRKDIRRSLCLRRI